MRYRWHRLVRRRWRDQLGLPSDVMLIGQLARVHPIKGHDLLLRAFAAIARESPNVDLVLIGAGTNDVGGSVATLAAELGIMDRIHTLGERADVPALLSGLDGLINPSRSEAFPNALAEGMLAGLPCIATAVGDTARLMNSHGVLVPPGDNSCIGAGYARSDRPIAERMPDDGARGSRTHRALLQSGCPWLHATPSSTRTYGNSR